MSPSYQTLSHFRHCWPNKKPCSQGATTTYLRRSETAACSSSPEASTPHPYRKSDEPVDLPVDLEEVGTLAHPAVPARRNPHPGGVTHARAPPVVLASHRPSLSAEPRRPAQADRDRTRHSVRAAPRRRGPNPASSRPAGRIDEGPRWVPGEA